MAGRGRTIAGWTAVLGLVTLAAAAIVSRDAIREAWHIHKLETGSLEQKVAAAERLGELRSIRAAPVLIEQFRILCAETEGAHQPGAYGAFQEALRKIGKPALPTLVRAVARAVSMAQNLEDGAAGFHWFIHETIEILYMGKPPVDLSPGQTVIKTLTDLKRPLERLRDDPVASPELREAAAESLKAFP